ncbi:EAL domain-containing protein, partial [Escherichia coli]|uniref:EAL domain-containing protein n=1 Tax=Escherichia coli TaxID=562 RepID=UPI0028DF7B34
AALDEGRVSVEYQPIVEMVGGGIIGFEALARWHDGDAMVPPCTFIPVAEDSGLIVPLGYLVLQRACRQLAALREEQGDDMPWV